MEKNFRQLNQNNGLTRREFLSAGALAAGLLICGKALADEQGIRPLMAELKEKFREMKSYGIPPAVFWTDPTMRKLLGAISGVNNTAARNGKTEPFSVFGATHEEQYRSLNSFLGKSQGSPFGPDSLSALENKLS
jgi:hypothetical protein